MSPRCDAVADGPAAAFDVGVTAEGSAAGSEDPEPVDVADAGRSLEVSGASRSEPLGVPASSWSPEPNTFAATVPNWYRTGTS